MMASRGKQSSSVANRRPPFLGECKLQFVVLRSKQAHFVCRDISLDSMYSCCVVMICCPQQTDSKLVGAPRGREVWGGCLFSSQTYALDYVS